MDICGIPLRIIDTAGLRDTSEYVEQLGVERTRTFLRKADLVLWVIDSSEPLTVDDKAIFGELFDVPLIVVLNKSDLPVQLDKNDFLLLGNFSRIVEVSSLLNQGLELLEKLIFDFATSGETISNDTIWISNLRHKDLLFQAKEKLLLVERGLIEAMPLDCIVIDLQLAHDKLGYIVGESVSIDIVDEIFSRFCVGK